MSRQYGQYCPIARTLDLLGDKWTLLIVRELLRGKRRFKDVEAGLRGIPPNLLSYRLKVLEHAGLITRQYFRELPPRVEYSLTEKGFTLRPVLDSIANWGTANLMQGDVPCEQVDLDLFFFHLPRFFCPEKAGQVNAVVEVRLTGEGGGSWFVQVANGACTVEKSYGRSPAAVVETDVDTWVERMAVHRNPAALIGSPDVRLEGDDELGARFASFFCREPDAAAPGLATGASVGGCA